MMIAYPCHPPFFTEQATAAARRDYFGGTAVQDILVSLIQGSEPVFAEGTELCRAIFDPVDKAHSVTPEQFALLEPAMSELIVATAACWMKAAQDAAIEHGVPVKPPKPSWRDTRKSQWQSPSDMRSRPSPTQRKSRSAGAPRSSSIPAGSKCSSLDCCWRRSGR